MRRKEIEMASIVITAAIGIIILAGGIYFVKIGRRSGSVEITWIGAIMTLVAVLVLIAIIIGTTLPLP